MLRFARTSILLCLPVLLLMGCGEEEEVAENPVLIPDTSPTAIADLPEEIEEATIEIASGEFGVDNLVLQEGAPTVLFVVNADDQPYRFQIVEDLLTATAIAAGTTTEINFTTPNAATYEGQLLGADTDEVLDTLDVVVQAPGAVQP